MDACDVVSPSKEGGSEGEGRILSINEVNGKDKQ